ncbi:MAG: alkaline phosphatase D family protein [Bacteroidota bacterium]
MRSAFITLLFVLGWLPLAAQIQLPANMYADTSYAPFLHGVASGDPLTDRVLIWTKVDPLGALDSLELDWEVATDFNFNNVVTTGTVQAYATSDWTAQHDVSGLAPGTRYYYRFLSPGNQQSRIGRTRTAPSGPTNHARFAVMSCSSIYSGFFNAYRRIGERNNLDRVIHLGDYLYDFVDPDEPVRVPVPDPVDPSDLASWRERHAYYLLDPDLRLARQNHPWTVIWDNHDIDADTPQQLAEAEQAFYEYVPTRIDDPSRPDLPYRRLQFGDLVDIIMLDAQSLRDQDTISGNELSVLSDAQWNWLAGELSASTARWRVIGNQKMFTRFSIVGLPSVIPFGDGPVADSSAWDGYTAERNRILNHLVQNNIDNNIFISGDIHMSFASDLAIDWANYDPQTGAGSVAVEFLPTSITRGNFDEAGFGGFIAGLAKAAIDLANPHHVFSNLLDHGYGILDIRPDSAVAEFWYSDLLALSNSESFETAYLIRDADNHWDRDALDDPIVALDAPGFGDGFRLTGPIPNPGQDQFRLELALDQGQEVAIRLIELGSGKVVRRWDAGWLEVGAHKLKYSAGKLAAGVYGLVLEGAHFQEFRKWVIRN